ncbi:MAG: response regulator [Phycisphaeraceae bacterium]|nr:response regulator [Phycisphaerales bacterium]MCB9860587.1 response regulator [Phycisphaeraceae bacterium]
MRSLEALRNQTGTPVADSDGMVAIGPQSGEQFSAHNGHSCPVPGPNQTQGMMPRLNLLLTYTGWRSDSWADALPQLLAPMGVRALRAHCGDQAAQLLEQSPIHIAIVDLGLPMHEQGASGHVHTGGLKLLRYLSRLPSPPPTVIVKQAHSARDDRREVTEALRSGAFAVVDRPTTPTDTEILLEVLRRCLSRYYAGRWPGSSTA